MTEIRRLLASSARNNDGPGAMGARPARALAIVTCMDVRIDPLAIFGLRLGEAHVIRNAGGRVTNDVLRSLTLSTRVLGVQSVLLLQHTGCGLEETTNEHLREVTGADLEFLPIADHGLALKEDVERLAQSNLADAIAEIAGCVYDVTTGDVNQLAAHERAA